jgi:partner of Y14 and mago protein
MSSLVSGGDRRIKNDDGTTVIAATLRPDGTVRKERKVKPGYTPPDEIAAYDASKKIAAKRGISHKTGPVSGSWSNIHASRAANPKQQIGASASSVKPKTKAQRKNEARKKRRAETKVQSTTSPSSTTSITSPEVPEVTKAEKQANEIESLEKNIRKLKKKLSQIGELEELETLNESQEKKLKAKGTILQRLSIAETSLQSLKPKE